MHDYKPPYKQPTYLEAYAYLAERLDAHSKNIADYPFVEVRAEALEIILQKLRYSITFQNIIGQENAVKAELMVDKSIEIPKLK